MNRIKRKKLVLFSLGFMFIFALVFITIKLNYNSKSEINRILKSEAYSYLSPATKNYIKEVYEKTGELVLTEKNKKENKPYLNPKYSSYLSLSNGEQNKNDLIPRTYVIDFSPSENYNDSQYPETYNISNINNNSYITPLKNQGSLGLCWSFATIEQAESYLMVRDNKPYDESTQKFSIRQMDYATSNNGIKNYENENGYRALTSGGNFFMSSMIMSNGLSLVNDNYMPYNYNEEKKELVNILNYNNSVYELNSSIMMPNIADDASSQDRLAFNNIVKKNIIDYGGAYVGTGSPNGSCGIKNIDGKYTIIDSDNCVGSSGHAMQIVGWDDNYNYSYCKTDSSHLSVNDSGACSSGSLVNGTGAWLLRNSWGDDSAYNFVYLAYESYGFDIDFTTSLTDMKNKKWDNNYHKNLWVNGTSYKTSNISTFYKKIKTNEKVDVIKFLSASVDGKFSVSIKTGDNIYNDIKNVQVEYPGIYSIDLSKENIILDDSEFSITISSKNDAYTVENSISVFTSNIEDTPQINTKNMDGSTIKVNFDSNYEFIVYSSTKNIFSNQGVTYSLLNNTVDYSNYIISSTNNKVAENNINSVLTLDKNIPKGTYTLRISYKGSSFDSTLIIPSIRQLAGEGTENNPYQIYTEDDLNQIRFNPDDYYLLKNNITLTEDWNPIGTVDNPFKGGFDGGNNTISGLKIEQANEDAVGFFGYVEAKYVYDIEFGTIHCNEKSYIKNITFKNASVSNDGMAGILIGRLTFNPTDAPDGASNVGSPNITIDNVNFIGGNVISNISDAGVIAANMNIIPKNWNKPNIKMNNIYSSATISGYHSAGIVGYINDSFESASGIMLEFTLKNFQNVGIIDETIFNISYSNENNYSPVIGGIYGNAKIVLENYIINSTFNDVKYMSEFSDEHGTNYALGSYDKKTSQNFTYNLKNGYYISKYPGNDNFISVEDIKDYNFSSKWTDFDKYWKIETVVGVKRMPVLKNIEYQYKNIPDAITLKVYDEKSLFELLNEKYEYISFKIISNNYIIKINYKDNNGDYYNDDIMLKGLQKGKVDFHIVNEYDGLEKDITLTVVADKVEKPTITYYYNEKNNNENYSQQVNALESFKLTQNQFTRAGYIFGGWNTISDGSGKGYQDKENITSGIDENLRLYAQWTKKIYTLSFSANGGTGTMNDWENISLDEGSYLSIPPNKYNRTNYTFKNWNTKADGSGNSFDNSGSISYEQLTSIDGVVMRLYAQWQKINGKISFSANGGTGTMNDLEVKIGNNQVLLANSFTRENYKFKNWNTKADGSGNSYSNEQTISISDDITLYAIWEKDSSYVINKYNVDETNKYISKIIVNTTLNAFNSNIILGSEYTIDVDYKEINNQKVMYTGGKTRISKGAGLIKEYTNVVIGDINGDGAINSADLLKVRQHLLSTKILSGEYFLSSDINYDNAINSADLLRIRQHLLGTKPIE